MRKSLIVSRLVVLVGLTSPSLSQDGLPHMVLGSRKRTSGRSEVPSLRCATN